MLAPIAFVGAAWDVTRGWIGKWAAFVTALIISKLALVVVFLIAITQVSTPIGVDLSSVTEPISGIVLLFIAAFAPYMVYRFISFLGFDLYHAMGSEREAKSAVNRPVPVPLKTQGDGVKKVLGGGSGNGGGVTPTARSAPSAPTSVGATSSGTTAGAGAGAGAASGSGTGAAAGAGPAAAVIIGAEVVKGAATAGPQVGQTVGGTAETAAASAGDSGATGTCASCHTATTSSTIRSRAAQHPAAATDREGMTHHAEGLRPSTSR